MIDVEEEKRSLAPHDEDAAEVMGVPTYRFKLIAVEDPSLPPPMPARAIGIESSAILIIE